jgi:nucleoside-diphosphate-sugar epimerase
MNLLITGASGFVGSALCSSLRNSPNWGVTTLSFSNPSEQSIAYVFDESKIKQKLINVDVVIHLAGLAHQKQTTEAFTNVNLDLTTRFANLVVAHGVKRFVYVSSVKVNGEQTLEKSFSEFDIPQLEDAYGISKWQAEQGLLKIAKEKGLEVVIVRPPLVYGPKVKANFLALLKLACKKLPIPLGAIKNKRSMIYVENLVDALLLCATHPKAAGNTYLVSDGEDVSTPELINKIGLAMNNPALLFNFPIPLMRLLASVFGKQSAVDRLTQSLVIDSSKIRNELGWQPPFSMDEGLKSTVDWYLEQHK